MRCTKCPEEAIALLSFDYSDAKVWLDEGSAGRGHVLCRTHADRFTPPVGWVVVDRRSSAPQVITLEVA